MAFSLPFVTGDEARRNSIRRKTGQEGEALMSDYGNIYLIDTVYNPDRDATEVTLGYIEKEEDVRGRIMSLRVIVNVPGHRDDEKGATEAALAKARAFVKRAIEAPYEPD